MMQVELDGKHYTWNGSTWYESESFISPPLVIVRQLHRLLDQSLTSEEQAMQDIDGLLKRARDAGGVNMHARAEALIRRALKLSPGHLGALAMLCSTLRARHKPMQALNETEQWKSADYPPLLTSRAAALCDLGRWVEARQTIARVLAMGGSDEAWSVVHRIKKVRPDLYR